MSIQNFGELNSMQIDVLREIGSIGSGNAATSLSQMLDSPVGMNVPVIKIMDVNQAVESLGGPEQMKVGLLIFFEGDIHGMMMFLLEKEFAHTSLGHLLGKEFEDFSALDELSMSALKEVANIMISSYINSIAHFTNLSINISVPSICIDMLGAMISVPATYFEDVSDKLILIEEEFTMEKNQIKSHMLMIPDMESLERIMESLGLTL